MENFIINWKNRRYEPYIMSIILVKFFKGWNDFYNLKMVYSENATFFNLFINAYIKISGIHFQETLKMEDVLLFIRYELL